MDETTMDSVLSTPENEEETRIAALGRSNILDTLPEQGYDDVTRLAAFICGTPISLVSFVDRDRQWFKSVQGLDAQETSRSASFCAHTIGPRQTLIVEDAQKDPRFQGNPLVVGNPNIRFYAGAPIIEAGQVLGTVCVIDTVPRSLSTDQIAALEALARQVTTLLEHRRGLAEAREEADRLLEARKSLRLSEARFSLAADAAGIAYWFFDPIRGVVGGDERMGRLFGLSLTEGPAELWLAAIHPEDRERVGQEFADGIAGRPYDTEYRVVTGTSYRWVRAKARLLSEDLNHRMVGICEDITDRKVTEDALRSTAERLQLAQAAGKVATWEWDLANGSLLWGEESRWVYGRPPSELDTIEKIFALLLPEDVPHVMERVKPAVEGTGEYNAEFRIVWPDESIHWTLAFGKPVANSDGRSVSIVGFNIDISDRKAADEALIRTEKLAAVGRLASSMAHEINNPLEAVTNLIYLARTSSTLEDAWVHLESADTELRRASAITSKTLRFHRQQTRPMEMTVEGLTHDILNGQHSRLTNAHIRVEKRDRSASAVLCFEGEIRQVLNNLIGNAIDAMHGRGGTLFLRGREGHDWRSGQKGIVITIADTGIGMSAATKMKLFDAFYTTKGIGGTGLGLWISREIVDRHHGRLSFRSRECPNRSGSVFTLFLPSDPVVPLVAQPALSV